MPTQGLRAGTSCHGFIVERVEKIPELRSEATVFAHERTGGRLLHLFNEDPNNLFCIAFRTPVFDNTGVPHILEHSVLAGSRKFPLKDPFKEMLKGSLQTFLNALTYPDKTIYPVSSQVEKDFYNLVDVYCDAVFHPLLAPETFQQEGWHFDLQDLHGEVSIKGIVYNEMKGVFSDFRSHVSRKSLSALYPDTTYFFESGGEPEHIVELTHEQFVAFHGRYYHPSNSFIVLYGNIPSVKTLAFLEDNYLGAFERREVDSRVIPQKIWSAPRRVEITAPASKEEDGTASVIVCWLFGDATDPVSSLLGRILSRYLLGSEGSPLRRALIDSGLGEDLDDMSGFEPDLVQTLMAAGLRKTKAEQATAIRDLVSDTIRKEVEGGLDGDLLEGALRQTEFRLREIVDSGFPYNLNLAERCYQSWVYGGDPLAHLKFEEPLATIKREHAKGTAYFAGKMRELFLENPHHVVSVIVGSAALGEELGKQTERQAQRLTSGFDESRKRECHELTRKLLREQTALPSAEALATIPKLSRGDLPPKTERVPVEQGTAAGVPIYAHPLFTSGIVYCDIGFDLSVLPPELLRYFPLYSELITRCGAAGFTSEQMAKRISLSAGGIGNSDLAATRADTEGELVILGFLHGKALPERFGEMLDIFSDLLLQPSLNDTKLVHDILLEMRNSLQASVTRSGHQFAMGHAASRLCRSRHAGELLGGVSQLRFLDRIIKEKRIDEAIERVAGVHSLVVNRRGCIVSVTHEDPAQLTRGIESLLLRLPEVNTTKADTGFVRVDSSEPAGIEISSSVNYVARSWRLDTPSARDGGLLHLMARNLSTGYLWDKVRVEGGAYGGMAIVSSGHPVFSCASYRDPNLGATLQHFVRGLEGLAAGLEESDLAQSVVGTIGRIDTPSSPHSKGFGETTALLLGSPWERRQQLREAVLAATPSSVASVARRILEEPCSATTVLGSASAFELAGKEGHRFAMEPLL